MAVLFCFLSDNYFMSSDFSLQTGMSLTGIGK
jgi:hypothetical protein